MTIAFEAALTCDEPGCDASAVVTVYLRPDRHTSPGAHVAVFAMPTGWTPNLFGGGHRCEPHEAEFHKRERLAYEARAAGRAE